MPTPWARTGSNFREIPGSSHTSSTAEGPCVVVPEPWAGESTQAPSRTEASVSSVAPTSAAREPAAFSASGVEIPSLDTPVAPLGCLAAATARDTQPAGVRSSIRKGNSLPSWRILALRQLISAPSGSRRPPSSGPSTSKPRGSQLRYLGVEVVRGRAEIYKALTRNELSPSPDVVRGIFGVDERDQLEVGSILEWYEGVACQAVGVLTTRRHRETQSFVIG